MAVEQTFGMVYGVIVRSVGLARNIVAFFRMIKKAKLLGADGIIAIVSTHRRWATA